MLSLRRLSVTYKKRKVLHDISLEIGKGVTVIIGLNGAGKTTLLKAVLSLIPSEGEIIYSGEKIKDTAKVFSYIPQLSTAEGICCLDFAAMGKTPFLPVFSHPSEKDRQKASELIDELIKEDVKGRMITEISGGQLKLLYIARALMQNTPYLLCDEPCTGLDYNNKRMVYEMLGGLKDKGIIITEHDPHAALHYADRIIILDCGRVVSDIKKDEFINKAEAELGKIYSDIRIENVHGELIVLRGK